MTLSRLSSIVIAFFVVAIMALGLRLEPAALNPLVYALTAGAVLALVVIIGPTLVRPRIGALSERAFIGLVITFLGLVASVIVYNTDHDRILFDAQTAALLFREAIIGVLLVPTVWLLLFVFGKLGQSK